MIQLRKLTYKSTLRGCFMGYVIQAAVNNFLPLLFVMLHDVYGITLAKIAALVTVNFAVQLTVDLLSVVIVDKIGYRICVLLAHFFSAAGLVMLAFLPDLTADPFTGILICVVVYALGGGSLEVLISPMVEACPTENKEKTMSMLHSFYCWGSVAVVLLTALFFRAFGIENWRVMAAVWSMLPVANGILFCFAPIYTLGSDSEKSLPLRQLLSDKMFWIFLILMLCAGASELSVSQWASAFAERTLGISKAAGDLAGPTMFAVLMGTSRALYGKYGDKIKLEKGLIYSAILCVFAYALTVFAPHPALSLAGCAIAGFAVGLMWPGVYSIVSARMNGGTAMFALLALAGDLGCSVGPSIVGTVSGTFGDNIRTGLLAASVFPIIFLVGMLVKKKNV